MKVNEPLQGKGNCVFRVDHIVVAEPIPPGTQLTLYYGTHYDGMRELQGYTLPRSVTREYDFPVKTRKYTSKAPKRPLRDAIVNYWMGQCITNTLPALHNVVAPAPCGPRTLHKHQPAEPCPGMSFPARHTHTVPARHRRDPTPQT